MHSEVFAVPFRTILRFPIILAAGKGFKRQLVTPDSTSVGTVGRGYFKGRSTEPFLQHPDPSKSELSRLFTATEHARLKGIPPSMVDGLSETIAHEVLGQSVVYPVFQAVGEALGMALTNQVINPGYTALQEEGIDSYCMQVCGGAECVESVRYVIWESMPPPTFHRSTSVGSRPSLRCRCRQGVQNFPQGAACLLGRGLVFQSGWLMLLGDRRSRLNG